MKTKLISLTILCLLLLLLGCASDKKVDELQKQLIQTSTRLDSLIASSKIPSSFDTPGTGRIVGSIWAKAIIILSILISM